MNWRCDMRSSSREAEKRRTGRALAPAQRKPRGEDRRATAGTEREGTCAARRFKEMEGARRKEGAGWANPPWAGPSRSPPPPQAAWPEGRRRRESCLQRAESGTCCGAGATGRGPISICSGARQEPPATGAAALICFRILKCRLLGDLERNPNSSHAQANEEKCCR